MLAFCPSPNCGPRRHGGAPDMVVLHYTAMATAKAAIERLCDPRFEVSAHYVIAEDGTVIRLVSETERAWHAGAGAWGDVTDVNSRSIGIEMANGGPDSDAPAFPEPQMAALETLLAAILKRWDIVPERVIAHSDMAPGRKFDPGPYFDWRRLAQKGLSVWPEPGSLATPLPLADFEQFSRLATRFGYRAPEGEGGWQKVLEAFRLRFRPFANGSLACEDIAMIHALAERWEMRA